MFLAKRGWHVSAVDYLEKQVCSMDEAFQTMPSKRLLITYSEFSCIQADYFNVCADTAGLSVSLARCTDK